MFIITVILTIGLAVSIIAGQQRKKSLLQKQRHALAIQALEVEERVYKHISSECHDNISQCLSVARLILDTMLVKEEINQHQKSILEAANYVSEALKGLRNLSQSASQGLVHKSIADMLKLELQRLVDLKLFVVHFNITGIEWTLDPERQLIVYRMVQEIINNTIKHANANQIEVYLKYTDTDLLLELKDNGKGFDPGKVAQHKETLGIRLLQDKARLIGATLSINSGISKGTIIQTIIPREQSV
jgi:two-component system NarL family sensor kinase